MKSFALAAAFGLIGLSNLRGAEAINGSTGVSKLPVALDKDFEFRKTKLFFLSPTEPTAQTSKFRSLSRNAAGADASIGFERSYRFFGALTSLDRRQRLGDYFDFFW